MFNDSQAYQTNSTFVPQVSVIVPIYNGERDLPDLIDCLCQLTYPKDKVEYLLVNNNSSDQTAQVLEIAAQKLSSQGLKLIPLTENKIQSSYAARNKGIRISQYDILAFTDADCRPCADWLEKLVQPFTDTTVGIVAGDVVALPGKTWLEIYADRANIMSQKFLLEHPFCPYGQTANLALRKCALEKVGLFRPYLTTGGDADICWRILRETDWKLHYAADAIIRHRHRSDLRSFKSQLRRYGHSNRYLHELYGVALMREFTNNDLIAGISRWLLKDIPKSSLNLLRGKADAVDFIKTPLDLMGFQSRSQGQAEVKLPEAAKKLNGYDSSYQQVIGNEFR